MKHTSLLLKDAYGTEDMRAVWDECNMVQKWLDVEAAIAGAQKELNLIPGEAADKIIEKCTVDQLSPDMVAAIKADARHLIVSFIKAFEKICGPSGEYFHLGATTQDILDTGCILQIREAYTIIINDLIGLEKVLIGLAEQHKDTIMMGRTHAQHAAPLTFGFKVAIWASEIGDHIDRLSECAQRLFMSSISGAVGSNASFVFLFGEEKAEDFRREASRKLGLEASGIDLHQRIDRFSELLNILALVGATLGRLGLEIRDLQRTEIAEVREPWESGKHHSSSTMPHKRNPASSEWQSGLAQMLRANAFTLSGVQMQHERDATWMALQLSQISESFLACAAAIKSAMEVFQGLEVYPSRMCKNLDLQKGLAMSEAVMLALYKKTGRKQTAHRIVYEASNQAWAENSSMLEVLLDHQEARKYLTQSEIQKALDPKAYCGNCAAQVNRVVAALQDKLKNQWSSRLTKQSARNS